MTKDELIEEIAKGSGLTKTDAGNALNAFVDTLTASLKEGEKVTLVGFGTFSVSERQARTGRNPRTGEEIQIPAAKVPKFTVGKGLKDALN